MVRESHRAGVNSAPELEFIANSGIGIAIIGIGIVIIGIGIWVGIAFYRIVFGIEIRQDVPVA